jgi:hypothetical protein
MRKILLLSLFSLFLITCCSSPTEPDAPPDVININFVSINNSIVYVSWNASADKNFQRYTLLGSYNSDFSNPAILLKTEDRYSVSYSFDVSNEWGNYPKYFALRVTSNNGLSATSPVTTEDSLHNLDLPLTEFISPYSGSIFQLEKTIDQGFVGADRNRFYKILNNGLEYSGGFGNSAGNASAIYRNLYNILVLSSGEILATGDIEYASSNSHYHVWELFDPNQAVRIWSKMSNEEGEYGFKMIESNNGNLLGVNHLTVMEMDNQGNEIWKKDLTSFSHSEDNMTDIALTIDNALIVSGVRDGESGARDIFVCKLDNVGEEIWCKTYGPGNKALWARKIFVESDGSYIIYYRDSSSPPYLEYLMKIDDQGNVVFDNLISSSDDIRSNLKKTDSGFVAISNTHSGDDNIVTVSELDYQGNELSSIDYYSPSNRPIKGNDIVKTSDGEYVIGGKFNDYNQYNSKDVPYIFRLDSEGQISRTITD